MSVAESFAAIGPQLPGTMRLLVRESVGSTNDEARLLGETGAPDGTIVLAQLQTAGRGRRGAAWISPPGESLAFSILVRPTEPKALWPRLALAAGLAVAEAAESFSLAPAIKWPNDVWIARKKIAGILVEAHRDFAVIGIGININTLAFPPEVQEIATSFAIEAGHSFPRPDVLLAILERLEMRKSQIGSHFPELLQAVRIRCALTGNPIRLSTPAGPLTGTAEGIGPSGELMLRLENGQLQPILQADEIRLC